MGTELLPAKVCPHQTAGASKEIYHFTTLYREIINPSGPTVAEGPGNGGGKFPSRQRAVSDSIIEKLSAVGMSGRPPRVVQEWDADFDAREDQVATQCGGEWGGSWALGPDGKCLEGVVLYIRDDLGTAH